MPSAPPTPPPHAHRTDWCLTALLTLQVVILFVATPLGTRYTAAHVVLDVCRMLYAAVSVAAFARRRPLQIMLVLALVLLFTGPTVAQALVDHTGFYDALTLRHWLIEGASFVFNIGVTALMARHVFGPGRVNAHRVRGGVLIYLNIAAIFAIAYNTILNLWPGALMLTTGARIASDPMGHSAALTYFSLTTITTTGYGDIVPVQPMARALANLESVIGQLFPATLLARIVALHVQHNDLEEGEG